MNNSNQKATWIYDQLNQKLHPSFLDVVDQGWQHIGHAEEGAGHFLIRIASKQFENKSLRDCHQLVYQSLGDAVGTTIHSLEIDIQS